MEEGKLVGIMMIDQSAAFDLCDHQLLIEKTQAAGSRSRSCPLDGKLPPGEVTEYTSGWSFIFGTAAAPMLSDTRGDRIRAALFSIYKRLA